ncbi:MAG: peptidase MA family metallohydrolase, partial [Polyangiaceae bacterium]
VQPLIAEADSFRKVLSTSLGRPVLLADEKKAPPVWVIVARSPGEMASYAPDGYPPPAYASGVAYSSIGLVLLTIDPVTPGQPHVLEEVFRHELAHVALYDAVGGAHVPRWFNEGFAVHVSGESSLARLQTLWVATVANNLIPLSNIDNGFPADSDRAAVAYAQSADIVRYLLRKQDTERLDSLLERVRPRAGKPGQPFEAAFNDAYGTSLSQLEFEWRADAAKRYTFWPVLFSGGFVWAGALVLFGFAWRRRRKHHYETLARWEREEAEEDRRRALAQNAVRVHIVVPGAESSIALREMGNELETEELDEERPSGEMAPPSDRGVPKVRHEGSWHTLH